MNRETIEAVYKLSPMQEGILFHSLLSPGTGSYVEQASLPWRGKLDRLLLTHVWQRMIEHHAVLRTSFLWEDLEQPVQVVHRKFAFELLEIDCTGLDPDLQEQLYAAVVRRDRMLGFDFKKPPLTRVTVFHLAETQFQVLWSYHHLLMDGWSSNLILLEMGAEYAASLEGRPYAPPRTRPYRDFLRWLEAQDLTKAESFWREKLADLTAPTKLSVMHSPAPDAVESYTLQQHLLPAELVTALQQRARENQLTFFTLVQAAWSLLLHHYSGERTVLYGITTSGRGLPLPGIEAMVGVFINTIPNPVHVDAKAQLATWLRALQSDQVRLGAYEYTPLTLVKSWSKIPREQPLFDTILVYQNFAKGAKLPKHSERKLGHNQVDTVTNFPLTLLVYPGDELLLRLNYDMRRFSRQGITRFLGHLAYLLEQLAVGLDGKIERLAFTTTAERQQLLVAFNASGAGESFAGDLFACLTGRAAAESTALVASDETSRELRWSHGELRQRAERLAACLQARGIGPDALVAVCCSRGPALPVALLGTLASGAAYLPLDPQLPAERLRVMLEDAGVALILTDLALDSAQTPGHLPVLRLDTEGAPPPGSTQAEFQPGRALPENLAYTIYTSGSTGKPKGVQVSRAALVNFLGSFLELLAPSADDGLLAVTTVSFDIAALELYLPLCAGGRLVLASREQTLDGAELMRLLERHDIRFMQATPATWQLLLANDWPGKANLTLLCGGEALPRPLAERLLEKGRALWNLYGPTETTIWSGARRVHAGERAAVAPVGPPIAATQLYILDRQLRPQAIEVVGDVYIGGAGLARGYRGRPALTAAAFLPHPFAATPGQRLYRTGDLGCFDEDGLIAFYGRSDHQVKLRGFRIELGEIDAVLCRHPAVREAATVIRGAASDAELVAFVALANDQPTALDQLRPFLAKVLPAYMIPGRFETLPALPRTTSGKIDRKALPELSAGPAPRNHVSPRNPTEASLARLWQDVLKREQVGVEDNFFDLGGHSLRLVQLRGRLEKQFEREIAMVDLFQHTTIAALARFLDPACGEAPEQRGEDKAEPTEQSEPALATDAAAPLAIIGLAGRFPGADSPDHFWANLEGGVNAIRFFSREELLAEGIAPGWLDHPAYVPARGYLEGIELFDAAFFGMTPREAEITDPQHRLFLEGAWQALEDAATVPELFRGRIGLFAGAAVNMYAFFNLMEHPEATRGLSWHQLMIGNDQTYLATRVAYKLDLKGPAVGVQTACSSSLVAVIQACTSLRAGQCDLALAGGIAVNSIQRSGYFHEPGGIMSADGFCRPFDARATGTVFGSGMGLVVLKRLAEAEADGDNILAVVRGFAVNNDGAAKVGYTAPSVEGQVQVIRAALRDAQVTPRSIGYVQTHGTGTDLGDPIEFTALTEAYGRAPEGPAWCALGSVKATIGHLDTAAGVAGLIAAVLALHHGQRPPNPMFELPNPEIAFAHSPFYINRELEAWPVLPDADGNAQPRRAAVSSFGIGGTNAHLILEQAPTPAPTAPSGRACLLPLSARTPQALAQAAANLADLLEQQPETVLDDVAHTLQHGRRAFPVRAAVVADSPAEAAAALRRLPPAAASAGPRRAAILMCSGQGSQYRGMGRELYQLAPEFRHPFDLCAERLQPLLGQDIRVLLWDEQATHDLNRTALTQPLLFAIDYALARLWLSFGLSVEALIGHSIGELVAACLADVFTLDEALALVVKRGALMQAQPPGAMLAVAASAAALRPYLGGELELAAVNGPERCVVGGPAAAIALLESRLGRERVSCTRIATSHAFHTAAMEGALAEFRACFAGVNLRPPRIPIISNLSGRWLTESEAVQPDYWVQHLRQTVRFDEGLARLLEGGDKLLIEVGPGESLANLARARRSPGTTVLSSLPKAGAGSDWRHLLANLGLWWQSGGSPKWQALADDQPRRCLRLPTYPFERQRYWIGGPKRQERAAAVAAPSRTPLPRSFYLPAWQPRHTPAASPLAPRTPWLIFNHRAGFGAELAAWLRAQDQAVVEVQVGNYFTRLDDKAFALRPGQWQDYEALFTVLNRLEREPSHVLHLWNLAALEESGQQPDLDLCFYSLLHLTRALGARATKAPCTLTVLAHQLFRHDSLDRPLPERALLLGPVQVAAREFPQLRCLAVDLPQPSAEQPPLRLFRRLLGEHLACERGSRLLALRGGRCFERALQPVTVPPAAPLALAPGGVYLITGGLGGMGLAFAQHLANHGAAHLILCGRRELPPRPQWPDLIVASAPGSERLAALVALETAGAELWCRALDVADEAAVAELAAAITSRYGRLDGVIHAAGIAGGGLIPLKTREAAERVLAPKVVGTRNLAHLLAPLKPAFMLLCSSISALEGEFGQVDYCAANAYLDAFAEAATADETHVIAVNWGAWREVGMAVETQVPARLQEAKQRRLALALTTAEGVEALTRVLAMDEPRVVVTPVPLGQPDEAALEAEAPPDPTAAPSAQAPTRPVFPRPNLASEYVAPTSPLETLIADAWRVQIGIDRVGLNDNFFELGGDSLLGLQIVAMINAALGASLTAAGLYEAPTVAALARMLAPDNPDESFREEQSRGSLRKSKIRQRRNIESGVR